MNVLSVTTRVEVKPTKFWKKIRKNLEKEEKGGLKNIPRIVNTIDKLWLSVPC